MSAQGNHTGDHSKITKKIQLNREGMYSLESRLRHTPTSPVSTLEVTWAMIRTKTEMCIPWEFQHGWGTALVGERRQQWLAILFSSIPATWILLQKCCF